MSPKILFICKHRNDKYGVAFGLINSCRFVCNALSQYNIAAKTITVIDNNCIDKEVSSFKPTHVFIEALWVVPEKFHILIKIYPTIIWHVRLHSRIPFLGNEGIAINWLRRYYNEICVKYPKHFFISANNLDIFNSLKKSWNIDTQYYPNIYSPPKYTHIHTPYNAKTFIDIGCFGAIRPMKNHLYQALAAISFGNNIKQKIRFHINADRIEMQGEATLKNLEESFTNTQHELIRHNWVDHKDFIGLVRSMDLGMQVSFSESFNIVAADFVQNNIPIVGSPEITWLSSVYKASPTNLQSIIEKLKIAYYGKNINLHRLNKIGLSKYNKKATQIWLDRLGI